LQFDKQPDLLVVSHSFQHVRETVAFFGVDEHVHGNFFNALAQTLTTVFLENNCHVCEQCFQGNAIYFFGHFVIRIFCALCKRGQESGSLLSSPSYRNGSVVIDEIERFIAIVFDNVDERGSLGRLDELLLKLLQ